MGKIADPTRGQADGLVILAVMAVLLYVFKVLMPDPWLPGAHPVPFSRAEPGSVPVFVTLDGREKGVYFFPAETTMADLLRAAAVPAVDPFNNSYGSVKLLPGSKIGLFSSSGSVPVVGKMSAPERLALDLPLDINDATVEDLMLVPGIGEKTATRIIALRAQRKGLGSIKELTEIKGIKEKKLASIKKYLYTAP